jgi:hypothetical protein
MISIGLIELPAIKLLDADGLNWTALRRQEPLGSKQVLAAQLGAADVAAEIVNLKEGDLEIDIGSITWAGLKLRKVAVGTDWSKIDAGKHATWGLTINYMQERDIATSIIRHLKRANVRVIVGGSDAFAEPLAYLRAGADAVVRDKSGAGNVPLVQYMAGSGPIEALSGVVLSDGYVAASARPPMSPEDWPLPEPSVVKATLGTDYWEAPISNSFKPIGSVMLDIGCDRRCSFCETPLYGLGYRPMSPARATAWLKSQHDAGARSVIVLSDQFLGRTLWPGGRADILDIMAEARQLGLAILWGNGLELKKATVGRSLPRGEVVPDAELVEAVWGWNPKSATGCAQAYIPAERPLLGADAYAKLLPWEQHCQMMEAVVAAGVPDINYGLIVGLPDDSHDELRRLLEGVQGLKARLRSVNPNLKFRVTPYAIRPLPGTPQAAELRRENLLRFEDAAILGGFWTACADTRHITYREVSEWQARLIGELSDPEENWQGITALDRTQRSAD